MVRGMSNVHRFFAPFMYFYWVEYACSLGNLFAGECPCGSSLLSDFWKGKARRIWRWNVVEINWALAALCIMCEHRGLGREN
jgi:hypothetical protein